MQILIFLLDLGQGCPQVISVDINNEFRFDLFTTFLWAVVSVLVHLGGAIDHILDFRYSFFHFFMRPTAQAKIFEHVWGVKFGFKVAGV